MKFFKPEDFMNQGAIQPILAEANCLADIANAKLKRAGKRVYSDKSGGFEVCNKESFHTHQAFLVCIEPLEMCKHPKEKVTLTKQYLTHGLVLGEKRTDCLGQTYRCECGARVEPNSFTEVKE